MSKGQWKRATAEQKRRKYDKYNELWRNKRKNNIGRAGMILRYSRSSDKKFNRYNNLTTDYIEQAISDGCHYCLAPRDKCRMSMDRKDNKIGHIIGNVIPSCVECNITRGPMVYSAWLMIVPILRQLRGSGLLKDWRRGIQSKG